MAFRCSGVRVNAAFNRLSVVAHMRGILHGIAQLHCTHGNPRIQTELKSSVYTRLASFPGLSGEGGKAWGLLRAHARKLPQNVVIAYYSNLSATFVSILSVKAWERC